MNSGSVLNLHSCRGTGASKKRRIISKFKSHQLVQKRRNEINQEANKFIQKCSQEIEDGRQKHLTENVTEPNFTVILWQRSTCSLQHSWNMAALPGCEKWCHRDKKEWILYKERKWHVTVYLYFMSKILEPFSPGLQGNLLKNHSTAGDSRSTAHFTLFSAVGLSNRGLNLLVQPVRPAVFGTRDSTYCTNSNTNRSFCVWGGIFRFDLHSRWPL